MNVVLNLLEALARAYASEERLYCDFLKNDDEKIVHVGRQSAYENMAEIISAIQRKEAGRR